MSRTRFLVQSMVFVSSLLWLLVSAVPNRAQNIMPDADLATITQRINESSLKIDSSRLPLLQQTVKERMATLQADGHWADIDYTNQNRASWAPMQHLSYLYNMTQLYCLPGQALYGDEILKQKILVAYQYWLTRQLRCVNWWYNDIGCPLSLARTMLLCRDILSPSQLADGIKYLDRYPWSAWPPSQSTGENLVWGTQIAIMSGCLEPSADKVQKSIQRMLQEICITSGTLEGIKTDMSFYQHGTQLYSGGYGMGFAADCAFFAYLVHGTRFAFPKAQLDLLSSYVLDGEQWMMRGRTFDYSAVGREITRPRKNGSGLATTCDYLAQVNPTRAGEFTAMAQRIRAGFATGNDFSGNRHFWKSDLMTHHRPGYYASVRVTSARLLTSEWGNDEGKLSHHLADGAMYLMRRGDEYLDIFPVWEWQRIPGTTVEYLPTPLDPKKVQQRGEKRFAGGVSDGLYGVAAMDFSRQALSAHKAWFFFDREIVCLGSGITCTTDNPVVTTINQCLLNGPVTVAGGNTAQTIVSGNRVVENLRWVHHDGIGYLFPTPCTAHVDNAAQSGSWRKIGAYSDEPISQNVFGLWLDHTAHPTNNSYAYIVLPDIAVKEMQKYCDHPAVSICSNTPEIEAVYHTELRLLSAAFFRPGSVTTPFGTVSVDQPCLMLLRDTPSTCQLTVANPENTPLTVTVTITMPLTGPSCSWDAQRHRSQIVLQLPDGDKAGQSVTTEVKNVK
ncbi:MAG TPA: polysaccharide lyase 8 family protein [Armatimonadota bacterium]|nr:polysaccharide lyase 8 family protein [Armatimonadota bacterium]